MALIEWGKAGLAVDDSDGTLHAVKREPDGTLTDLGVVQVRSGVAISAGDLRLGGVEIQDADVLGRARVRAGDSAGTDDIALVVADPNVLAALGSPAQAGEAAGAAAGLATQATLVALLAAQPPTALLDFDEALAGAATALLTAVGITFNAGLKQLSLVVTPNGDSDSIALTIGGAAVAGTNALPPGVYSFACSKAVADTIQVIRGDDEDVKITVIQEG